MPEDKELNNDTKIGRDQRPTTFIGPGQYVEGHSFRIGNVVYNFNIESELIRNLMASLTEVISVTSLIDPQNAIELANNHLSTELSKLTNNARELEIFGNIIASSEFKSIAIRLKSNAILARYLAEEEFREWLAEYMSYGCRQQLIEIVGFDDLHTNRQNLSSCLSYCLQWFQDYFSYLKPGIIPTEVQQELKSCTRRIFEEAFAVMEYNLKKDPALTTSELCELQQCVRAFYEEISLD